MQKIIKQHPCKNFSFSKGS